MVNEIFCDRFSAMMARRLGGVLAGPVTLFRGGIHHDHYKGLASSLGAQVIPLYTRKYEATEFVFGGAPLRDPNLPSIFFQVPVLDIKGTNVPGAAHFATFVRAPIQETIVTPKVGLDHHYLPLKALVSETPRAALKAKRRWTPLLEALNKEQATLDASRPSSYDATMGILSSYYVKVDSRAPIGLTQLAPFKGFTVLTAQRPPTSSAGVNQPEYDVAEAVKKFGVIAKVIAARGAAGEIVGEQAINRTNAAMMSLLLRYLDRIAGPMAAAPPKGIESVAPSEREAQAQGGTLMVEAPGDPQSDFGEAPAPLPSSDAPPACPLCGASIRLMETPCPSCKQDLTWN